MTQTITEPSGTATEAPVAPEPLPTPKQILANTLKIVADDCTFEDIRYHLGVGEMLIQRSSDYDRIMAECGGSVDEAIRRGHLIPQEQMEKLVDKWFEE